MFSKSFNIPNYISVDYINLNGSMRFLILKNKIGGKKYIKLSSCIFVNKIRQVLSFKFLKISQVLKFFRMFFSLYRELKYKIFKIILIRGVGLKVALLDKPWPCLELKLGYSHKILLFIPKDLNIIIKKKKFLVEGFDKILVGNFVNKILNFKQLNKYTGKGLWLKSYNKFILKEIKKI